MRIPAAASRQAHCLCRQPRTAFACAAIQQARTRTFSSNGATLFLPRRSERNFPWPSLLPRCVRQRAMVWGSAPSASSQRELVARPLKRLSRHYSGKSQSWASLDLALSSSFGESALALGKAAYQQQLSYPGDADVAAPPDQPSPRHLGTLSRRSMGDSPADHARPSLWSTSSDELCREFITALRVNSGASSLSASSSGRRASSPRVVSRLHYCKQQSDALLPVPEPCPVTALPQTQPQAWFHSPSGDSYTR